MLTFFSYFITILLSASLGAVFMSLFCSAGNADRAIEEAAQLSALRAEQERQNETISPSPSL